MILKRLAALAGMLGPLYFLSLVIGLTLLEYDFMRSLGWHPLYAPTFDWPSGLALGSYGIWMSAGFSASGLMVILFAVGLCQELPSGALSKVGSILLACAGLALMGLTFTTDPTIRSGAATWHGRLHDLSYIVLGLTLLPAMIVLGFGLRHDPRWHSISRYTWLNVILVIPAFILKGIAFYIFLLAIIAWCEALALKMNCLTEENGNG